MLYHNLTQTKKIFLKKKKKEIKFFFEIKVIKAKQVVTGIIAS